jgi:putative tricarboxylic transport membrane protein
MNDEDSQGGRRGSAPIGTPWHRRREAVAALVIAAICAAVAWLTTTFDRVPDILVQGMQPADFPLVVVGVILLLTVIMVVQSAGWAAERKRPLPPVVWRSVAMIGGFLVIATWVDLFLGLMAFFVALGLVWGERRLVGLVVVAVVLAGAIFVVFGEILQVRFPHGILTDLVYGS